MTMRVICMEFNHIIFARAQNTLFAAMTMTVALNLCDEDDADWAAFAVNGLLSALNNVPVVVYN